MEEGIIMLLVAILLAVGIFTIFGYAKENAVCTNICINANATQLESNPKGCLCLTKDGNIIGIPTLKKEFHKEEF